MVFIAVQYLDLNWSSLFIYVQGALENGVNEPVRGRAQDVFNHMFYFSANWNFKLINYKTNLNISTFLFPFPLNVLMISP